MCNHPMNLCRAPFTAGRRFYRRAYVRGRPQPLLRVLTSFLLFLVTAPVPLLIATRSYPWRFVARAGGTYRCNPSRALFMLELRERTLLNASSSAC